MSDSVMQANKICLSTNSQPAPEEKNTANRKVILNDVSFGLEKGKLLGIIGPNGAGKSSLLRILMGLQNPDSGTCTLNNKPFDSLSIKEMALQIAYLEQSPTVVWSLTAEHIVHLAFLNKSFAKQQKNDYAMQSMKRAEVWHLRHRIFNTLSGGERVRVMLARLFATQASILLLDEPLASLDPAHQLSLMKSLKAFAAEKGTVAVVLHDLNYAYTFCDKLLLLKDGEIFSHGAPKKVLSEKNIQSVYGVEVKIHHPEGGRSWIQLS